MVGRTGYGKTAFVQNLGKNKLLGDIKEVYWILKIELSADREDNIKDCFKDQHVDFKYPNNVEDFNLLEIYKRKKSDYSENYLRENTVLDRVITMDDVSDLADRSAEFANFLTVSQKYGLTCVYIFHTIYPTRQHWQMILSQTKIFNFFPGPIQASAITRILSYFAGRYKNNYIPHRDVWINRLYFEISNSAQKQCLTIDTRDVNSLEPANYRTQADNTTELVCYYNRHKKDTSFNCFLATRKETSSTGEMFSIAKVIDKTNRHDTIYSKISDKLSNFKNYNVQGIIQRASESNFGRKTTVESAKSQDLFQDNNPPGKKYTTTRIQKYTTTSLEIFSPTLLMLELTTKIFTTKFSFLISTCLLRRI